MHFAKICHVILHVMLQTFPVPEIMHDSIITCSKQADLCFDNHHVTIIIVINYCLENWSGSKSQIIRDTS